MMQKRVLILLLAVPVLAASAWCVRAREPEPETRVTSVPSTQRVPSALMVPAPSPTPVLIRTAAQRVEPVDAQRPGAPSHPITARHARIFRENTLLGAMDGAVDVGDGAGLQSLLDEYRLEYPDDPNLLQEGYQVLANCLQDPSAASSAAGRRYAEHERGSTLRTFVERLCFGQ